MRSTAQGSPEQAMHIDPAMAGMWWHLGKRRRCRGGSRWRLRRHSGCRHEGQGQGGGGDKANGQTHDGSGTQKEPERSGSPTKLKGRQLIAGQPELILTAQ